MKQVMKPVAQARPAQGVAAPQGRGPEAAQPPVLARLKRLLAPRPAGLQDPKAKVLAQAIAERTVLAGRKGALQVHVAIDVSWSMDGWFEAGLAAARALQGNAELRLAVWAERAAYVTTGLFGRLRRPDVGSGTCPDSILLLRHLATADLLVVVTDGEFSDSDSGYRLVNGVQAPIDWILVDGGTDALLPLREQDRVFRAHRVGQVA